MLHQLAERKHETVSSIWTGCHLILLTLATVLSMVCMTFFHLVMATFDMYCVLNPKSIEFLSNSSNIEIPKKFSSFAKPSYPEDLPIDFIKSQWSNDADCFAPLYNPLMSGICGTVLAVFFLMYSNSGRHISGLVQPWRIVVPSFIFCFVYSIVCLVITNKLTIGLDNLITKLRDIPITESVKYANGLTKIHCFIIVSIVTSWLYTLCWIFSVVLLILRCIFMPDFKLVGVKLELVKNNPVDNSTHTFSSILEDDTNDISMAKDEVQECTLIQVDVEPPKITSNVKFQPLEIKSD